MSEETKTVLTQLYNEFAEAGAWLEKEKEKEEDFYHLQMMRIVDPSDIPMPDLLTGWVDDEIAQHIRANSIFKSTYTFNLLGKSIIIHFIFEKNELDKKWQEPNIQQYNKHVDNILLWLNVALKHTTVECANDLTIFIYLTSFEKYLPKKKCEVLTKTNINTAVTNSCPIHNAKICIYRFEEWFKVFIHESFHTLSLDFSQMDISISQERIREQFHIPTEILLFEAYAEFWAKFINITMTALHLIDKKSYVNTKKEGTSEDLKEDFIMYAIALLDYERVHCFLQTVKILKHMNLTYPQLYNDATLLEQYKEETNVFVYYVITLIMINNYPKFIHWCYTHHQNLLQFKHTDEHQLALCAYIKENHNTPEILNGIKCSERLMHKLSIQNNSQVKKSKRVDYLLTNLRLSLCEYAFLQ